MNAHKLMIVDCGKGQAKYQCEHCGLDEVEIEQRVYEDKGLGCEGKQGACDATRNKAGELKINIQEHQAQAVIEKIEHALQSLKDLCGMMKVDKTCGTCSSWISCPKEVRGARGICLQMDNGIIRQGYSGVLECFSGDARYAPLTHINLSCKSWELK